MNHDISIFLDTLCETSPVTFQTFDDTKGRKLPDLTRVIHGLTDENISRLKDLNEKGAGVFVMVNEGDGKGRSTANVVKVRCVFADLDGSPLEPVIQAGLTPHIIVESSEGRYHAYWKVTDCDLPQFSDLQKRIAIRLNGDRTVFDLPRVMRIPGFCHKKEEPYLSRVLEIHDDLPGYTVEQIINGLGLPEMIEEAPTKKNPQVSEKVLSNQNYISIKNALSYINPQPLEYDEWRNIGFAVHHELGDNGFPMFSDWSKNDQARHTDLSTQNFWEGINGKSKKPITGAYIHKMAKEAGCNTIPAYVEEFNRDHFVAFDSGKTLVFHEKVDPVTRMNQLISYKFSDFINLYRHLLVDNGTDIQGKIKKAEKGQAWLDHYARRQYDGIALLPEKDIPGYYNLWRGFSVKPVQGSWQLMKDHILNNICSKDTTIFMYVMGWLANLVQNPGSPGHVAVVLKGGRGTGKGMLGNWICKLLGQHSKHVTHSRHVTGNFNAHLEDCIFMFADESFFAGDKQAENVLKSLITEPNLTIERKGKDLKTVPNMLHVLMASNSDWVVPAGTDERRYCVLEVSEEHKQDQPYFKSISEEMSSGGLSAMLFDLLEYDISNFEVRTVPQTNALLEQKLQSLDPFNSWWLTRLQEGSLLRDRSEHWGPVPTLLLYEDYRKYACDVGVSYKLTEISFGMNLSKLFPKKGIRKLSMKNTIRNPGDNDISKNCNHYVLPDLKSCRKYFESIIGSQLTWGEPYVEQSATVSKSSFEFIFDEAC